MWGNQGGYDGGGYDHGGGYLSSQSGSQNAGTNQDKKKSRVQNLLPCTVAQLLKAEQLEDKFVSGSVELNQVSLIGLVRSAQEMTTNQLYEIDDHTGPPMEVRIFVDNDENIPEHEKVPLIPTNTYVYVCGHLRSFSGKRNVTAFKVRPVTDLDEVTSHVLEVIYANAYFSKGANIANQPTNAFPSDSNAGDLDAGLTSTQCQVLGVVRSCMEDQGITIAAVVNKLSGMKRKDIEDAVEFLSTEGHVYSTVDDEHFKATDTC